MQTSPLAVAIVREKEDYEEGIFILYSSMLLLWEQKSEMVLEFVLKFKYVFILHAW